MGCFIGLLGGDVLGWWLLGLCITGNIKVAGNLEINCIHVGINRLDQLPYVGGLFLVCSIDLTLGGKVEEPGKGFDLGFSKGSPRPLLSPEGPPTNPPRTHGAVLNGQ